ncbi:MAG: hypothetical protein WBD36_10795 [Bacteroidota bacterium]
MGQQQLLLVLLAILIVGVAVFAGLGVFGGQNVQANKDAMINDIKNIKANAYAYRQRPTAMGGGNGAYSSYTLPSRLTNTLNGSYVVTPTATNITIVGTSILNPSYVMTCVLDSRGKLSSWTFEGDFQ